MNEIVKQEKKLADYKVFGFDILSIDLAFDIKQDQVHVTSILRVERTSAEPDAPFELSFDPAGKATFYLDDVLVPDDQVVIAGGRIKLVNVPHAFTLKSETTLSPKENTSFEGLYASRTNLYTQCEAEGFRRITPYADRPDVLSVFTVTITAIKDAYPVLLSNGNQVSTTDHADGRHTVVWHDPFPKPSYLFALVAGQFDHVVDTFITRSGQHVDLHFWTDVGDGDKVDHAIQSLKDAMAWDEKVYGLEYDLDLYNVVAVSDFNMGAMENKSLNIFNTSCVLARPETATDHDYAAVQAVVAHEYFHNWTGNRITCRDWFQLSLKEGLTVFRDQEFSSDMTSRAVKRIEDVRTLRALQFPEDAGPMAHPIRPDSYIEINNFYTVTIYEKGAEVIRMIYTLLGPIGFQKGMAVYVARHDGQAATCEDFVRAMEAGSGADLSQFRLWYSQAGTPQVKMRTDYHAADKTLALTFSQSTPPTPGQMEKKPLHIPVQVGVLDQAGQELSNFNQVLELKEESQTFVLKDVPENAVVSPLREFSAPVKLDHGLTEDEQLHLMAHDTDGFVRWDMTQAMAKEQMLAYIHQHPQAELQQVLSDQFVEAMRTTLTSDALDDAFKALLLVLPSESVLGEAMSTVDTDQIHLTRLAARKQMATALFADWSNAYEATKASGAYDFNTEAMGKRALNGSALAHMMLADVAQTAPLAYAQFQSADNMTDQMAALTALVHSEAVEKADALAAFYDRWQHNPLVIDKWFSVQASYPAISTLETVKFLMAHEAFTLKNPNRVRSLFGVFSRGNPFVFHQADGTGYRVLSDVIMQLDDMNPQIAARMVIPLTTWKRFDLNRQARMKSELERIAAKPNLSANTFEHVSKSLESVT